MNDAEGRNRIERLVTRRFPDMLGPRTPLGLYSLTHDVWREVKPSAQAALGGAPWTWVTHQGRKDIVIESTGAVMPLWHLQRLQPGASRPASPTMPADAVRMIAAPLDSDVARGLASAGVAPSATATVMQRGLDDATWEHLSSAEI